MNEIEKQAIEEMANVLQVGVCFEEDITECRKMDDCSMCKATRLYNAGYRKITTTDWLTKGISEEQLKKEKEEAFKEIAEQSGYRKQEWISVDERLPDREGKYLVCTTNGNIGVGNFIDYYGKGTHLCFDCWAVTHWMPLPEAPKMKGGAE